jgi:acetyl esterase/lipase
MASPELDMIVALLREAPLFHGDDVAAMRTGMEAMTASTPLGDDVRITAVDAGGVPAEWVDTEGARADTCVLYFHGGGYVIGSPRTHRGLVSAIGRAAGARVLSVDYRLAPEHPHPAAVEDGVRAWRFLREQGFAPGRIAIAGDSAGGGLTVATLLALRDAGDELPPAAVCISPWLDLTLSGESMTTKADVDPMVRREALDGMAAMYAGQGSREAPLASPLFADLAGLPEILVHVGTAETLLDDSLRFVARLREAMVEVSLDAYEDMIHVWHAFATVLPEARDAIGRIGDFLRRRLGA